MSNNLVELEKFVSFIFNTKKMNYQELCDIEEFAIKYDTELNYEFFSTAFLLTIEENFDNINNCFLLIVFVRDEKLQDFKICGEGIGAEFINEILPKKFEFTYQKDYIRTLKELDQYVNQELKGEISDLDEIKKYKKYNLKDIKKYDEFYLKRVYKIPQKNLYYVNKHNEIFFLIYGDEDDMICSYEFGIWDSKTSIFFDKIKCNADKKNLVIND